MKNQVSGWLLLIFIPLQGIRAQPVPPPAPAPQVIFLLLKMTKDSATGIDQLQLVEKIVSSGRIKRTTGPAAGTLTRLPYLSIRFYKGKTALDSVRYGYPLRERIQNTRENAQGFKDIEIRSIEFFFRFQQTEADLMEIYKIGDGSKKKLLSIDLQ